MAEDTKAQIAALIAEREHYVRYDKPDRVEAVDAELAKLGAKGKAPGKRAVKMTPKAPDAEL